MKFNSKKSRSHLSVLIILNIFFIGIFFFDLISNSIQLINGLIYFTFIFFLTIIIWGFFNTSYYIENKYFKYKSGPFYGKIEVSRINTIVKNKTLWSGYKMATATKGLIVKFDNYKEIYISPKSNELFIKEILKLNDKIKIV